MYFHGRSKPSTELHINKCKSDGKRILSPTKTEWKTKLKSSQNTRGAARKTILLRLDKQVPKSTLGSMLYRETRDNSPTGLPHRVAGRLNYSMTKKHTMSLMEKGL